MQQLESMEQFATLRANGKTIFLFSADWCGDCRFIEPVLPEIEAKFPSFTFIYVDRDAYIDLCVELDVFGIPSFIAYENGKELDRFVSKDRKTKKQIEEFITNLG